MQPIVAIFVVLLGVVTEYAKERSGLWGDALRPFYQRDSNTYEATKIELLEESNSSEVSTPNDAPSNVVLTNLYGANLLRNVEKSYDRGKKLLDDRDNFTKNMENGNVDMA